MPCLLHLYILLHGTILIKLAVKCTFPEFYNILNYCFSTGLFRTSQDSISNALSTNTCRLSLCVMFFFCMFAIGNLHSYYSNKHVEKWQYKPLWWLFMQLEINIVSWHIPKHNQFWKWGWTNKKTQTNKHKILKNAASNQVETNRFTFYCKHSVTKHNF